MYCEPVLPVHTASYVRYRIVQYSLENKQLVLSRPLPRLLSCSVKSVPPQVVILRREDYTRSLLTCLRAKPAYVATYARTHTHTAGSEMFFLVRS